MSKLNKSILEEELKKFRLLSEYNFLIPEADDEEEDNDEITSDSNDETPDFDIDNDTDSEFDDDSDDGDDFTFGDEDDSKEGGDDFTFDDEMGDDDGSFNEEPDEEEIEIDVTELVKDTEETKSIANAANTKMDMLMKKFAELQNSLSTMDAITKKIEKMERDLDKRMPTPEEKLEMRSLDSYPYSMKLTDYWSEKTGKYDVMDNSKKNNEYVLTSDDVINDYNNTAIKNSFDDFEEEDIEI